MYAVIQTGGKQHRVQVGQIVKVERIDGDVGSSVVFDRVLALSVLAAVTAFWAGAQRTRLERRQRLAANVMAAVAAIQVGLGISTLVFVVPIPLAAAHQAGAMVLFCASLWVVHESMRGERAQRPIPAEHRKEARPAP